MAIGTVLSLAGFDPEKVRDRQTWNEEKIIKGLRQLARKKLPLYPRYVMYNHQSLFSAALRQYGSWDKAVIAAGIKLISRRTRLAVLQTLRESLEARKKIPTKLRTELEYYCGSVKGAKLALKNEPRFANGWSKQKIVDIIARKSRAKESLRYATCRRKFLPLLSAAQFYFGSWGKALHAAGIDPNLNFVHHTWRKRR